MIRGAVFPHSRGGVVVGGDDRPRPRDRRDHRGRARHRRSQHISAHLFGPGDTLASDHREPVRRGDRHRTGPRSSAWASCCSCSRSSSASLARGIVDRVRAQRSGAVGVTAARAGAHCRRRPRSRSRKVKNAVATILDRRSRSWSRSCRSCSSSCYVVQQGLRGHSDWEFLTDDHPVLDRLPGPGMGPAVVGTLLITGAARADGGPARHPRRHLPQRVRRHERRSARFIRFLPR